MDIGIDKLIYVLGIFKLNNQKAFTAIISHLNFDEINDVNNVINGQNIYQLQLRKNVK